ncbi:MAG: aminomethyltransferase beta-barrel domain-containing protein, partial [Ilumatobacteraceae bacterium]
IVVVGDDADLLRLTVDVHDVTWVDGAPSQRQVLVQCSAHGDPQRATIRPRPDRKMPESARSANDSRHFSGGLGAVGAVRVVWDEPQRRIAPGQSVVFYDLGDTRVLGGGIAG